MRPRRGTITHPGSMQWFLIKDPGTYTIALHGAPDLEFRLYASTNLSTPLPQYRGETTTFWYSDEAGQTLGWTSGRKYLIPRGPFYMRVFSRDRAWTGPYELIVYRHTGTSKADAIVLYPNDPVGHSAPDPAAGHDDASWFQIDTERLKTGSLLALHTSALIA